MQLYELTQTYLNLQDADNDGFEFLLENIEDDIESQIENIGKVLQNISAEKDAYKSEISRMQNRVKNIDSRVDGLKEYLKTNMELLGIDKVGDIVKISLRNSPPSCNLLDIGKIPDDFKTAKTNIPVKELPEALKQYVVEEIISKSEIISLWKDGIEIDGTEVIQNKHVRIS